MMNGGDRSRTATRVSLCRLTWILTAVAFVSQPAAAQPSIDPILTRTPLTFGFATDTKLEKLGPDAIISGSATATFGPAQQAILASLSQINSKLGCSRSNNIEMTILDVRLTPTTPPDVNNSLSIAVVAHVRHCESLYAGNISVNVPIWVDTRTGAFPQVRVDPITIVPQGVYAVGFIPVSNETVVSKTDKAVSPAVGSFVHKLNSWIKATLKGRALAGSLSANHLKIQSARLSTSGDAIVLTVNYAGQTPIAKINGMLNGF